MDKAQPEWLEKGATSFLTKEVYIKNGDDQRIYIGNTGVVLTRKFGSSQASFHFAPDSEVPPLPNSDKRIKFMLAFVVGINALVQYSTSDEFKELDLSKTFKTDMTMHNLNFLKQLFDQFDSNIVIINKRYREFVDVDETTKKRIYVNLGKAEIDFERFIDKLDEANNTQTPEEKRKNFVFFYLLNRYEKDPSDFIMLSPASGV